MHLLHCIFFVSVVNFMWIQGQRRRIRMLHPYQYLHPRLIHANQLYMNHYTMIIAQNMILITDVRVLHLLMIMIGSVV